MDWDKIKSGAKELAAKGMEASKELAEKSAEMAKEKQQEKKAEKQELKDRIAQMDKEGTVYCPKCYSTNLSANKRGFKFGRALVGGMLTFGVGVMAGAVGKNKIEVTCMKCGHTWKAGK